MILSIFNKRYLHKGPLYKLFMDLDQFSYSYSSKKNTLNQQKIKCQSFNQIQKQKQKSTTNTNKQEKIPMKSKAIADPIKTFQIMLNWRKKNLAPVDTIGCERLADKTKPIQIQKYQTLVSLVLSVQTKDQITSMVTNRLKQHGLQPAVIANIKQSDLVSLIFQANFNKRKAKQLIEISNIILKQGMPKTKQELMNLPGVGTKIAMIYLRVAENRIDGIGVDTHVHRISNKLGWVKTNTPNDTELKLQQLFAKKYWNDINIAMVGFGQILCQAKKQLCDQCPVNKLCPSSNIKFNDIQW